MKRSSSITTISDGNCNDSSNSNSSKNSSSSSRSSNE